VSREARGRLLALAMGSALAATAAGAWPEASLPPNRAAWLEPGSGGSVVHHGEWAVRLAGALGLGALLAPGDAEASAFALLCPGRSGSLPGAPAAEGLEASQDPLRVVARVDRPGVYRMRVEGRGEGRWTVEGRDLGVLDPTPLGVAASRRRVPLAAGSRELVAFATPGARFERVELVAAGPPCVAPAGGWQAGAELRFGDKARTLVQLFGLEGRLPREGAPVSVEGEDFTNGGPRAVRTDRSVGRPASGDAWAQAEGGPAELAWNLDVPAAGVYSLLARVHGAGPQEWRIDEGAAVLRPPADAADFAWTEVATLALGAGSRAVRARLADGGGVDVIQLVRRRTDDADYLAVLEELGAREGGAGERVREEDAERNLRSEALRALFAGFRDGDPEAIGAGLALVERELEDFYTRPLSPVLPSEP
jgi:hypothetical protein